MRMWVLAAGASVAAVAGLSAQNINSDMRPIPGEYRSTQTLLSIEMPDAPPEMANLIKDSMSSAMRRELTYCLTAEEVEEGFRSMMNKGQYEDCTYDRFNAVGGRIDAQISCEIDGERVVMTMEGTGSPTSSDVTMNMKGNFGMGDSSMSLRVVQERIGDC